MVTIRDVAKEANVSVATVSRFINDKGYVSEDTRNTIAKAIEKLEYRPSSIARSLSIGQTNFIGLILPDIMNPFFPELARAVEDIALTYGYTVILCNSDEDEAKEAHYVETLKQKYVAGLIVISNRLEAKHYREFNLPIVAMDRPINETIPTVTSQNIEGARMGTNALVERGCKHILFLKGPNEIAPSQDREIGFLQTIEKTGVEYTIVECPFHFDDAETIVREVMKQTPSIDGIFASSDVSAAGALKAVQGMGISVPSELQIVGFDGIALGAMLIPGLTTVAQDIYQMGAFATRMLIKKIEGKPVPQTHIQVPVKLVERQTTKPVK